MKQRVADVIVQRLEDYGIKHIFMISGGGAMHLNDAVGRSNLIQYVNCHHEQAAAIAAEGYSRANRYQLSVVCVTSGPGGTNTLTGVMGQWTDSVPVIYISGQVKTETTIHGDSVAGLRQLGDQEADIISIVKPLTKYAVMVKDPEEVIQELEKAIELAISGRKGPVWLDVPLDVQGALVDYKPTKLEVSENCSKVSSQDWDKFDALLKDAERPLVVAGHGVRIDDSLDDLEKFILASQIPVVTTFNGFDTVSADLALYVGRIGTIGSRAGNFALQNSDLIITIGTRNNIRQISYNTHNYAHRAKKIVVDIDCLELKKKTVSIDLPLQMSAKSFLREANRRLVESSLTSYQEWCHWCQQRRENFPPVNEKMRQTSEGIHPYVLLERLTELSSESDTVVAGDGTACVGLFQAGVVNRGQRFFWNSGCASMGYDLPAAIGAAFATRKSVICVAGDGSIMMNLQELQTVVHHQLPIKIILLNNDGYQSIKQTQSNYFNGNVVGCCPESGVSFPNFKKIAQAFGLDYFSVKEHETIDQTIENLLKIQKPIMVEVFLNTKYNFEPKLSSVKLENGTMLSKPLEDLSPLLSREDFKKNML